MNYLTYATGDKFFDILDKQHITEDLRIPRLVRDCTRNIIIQGQVWGRRGNMKLISMVIFSGSYNDNEEAQSDMVKAIKDKDPGARTKYSYTRTTLTLNIMSRNLTNVLKGVADVISYLVSELGLSTDMASVNISTDLPNWKGTNYFTSDPYYLLQTTQAKDSNSQCGVFHLNVGELDDLVLLMIVQTALNLYPRVMIKTDLDEVTKRFFINKIEDLVLETRSQINLSLLDRVISTK